jgi:hypothetical protein
MLVITATIHRVAELDSLYSKEYALPSGCILALLRRYGREVLDKFDND